MKQYTQEQQSELYKRIIAKQERYLIKVGTFVITDPITKFPDETRIDDIVDQTAMLYHLGKEVALVSSGAIGAGKAEMHRRNSKNKNGNLPRDQALAAIGQPDLMYLYRRSLERYGLTRGQILLSYDDLHDPVKIENFRNTVRELYELDAIPILNENDPVSVDELLTEDGTGVNVNEEKRFGDNDRLSAMAGIALGSQVLFMLSREDGMRRKKGGKFNVVDYQDLEYLEYHVTEEISDGGQGGMPSKLDAIQIATENEIFVVLLRGLNGSVITKVMDEYVPHGTLFLPKSFKYPGKGE